MTHLIESRCPKTSKWFAWVIKVYGIFSPVYYQWQKLRGVRAINLSVTSCCFIVRKYLKYNKNETNLLKSPHVFPLKYGLKNSTKSVFQMAHFTPTISSSENSRRYSAENNCCAPTWLVNSKRRFMNAFYASYRLNRNF